MRKTSVLIPIIALVLSGGAAVNAAALEDNRVYAVEVVSVDVANKVLRIRSTEGGVRSYMIDDSVLEGLRAVRAGDRVTISVRDEITVPRKTVTAFVAGSMTPAMIKRPAVRTVITKQAGTPVEFVNLDPTARRITVLDEYGEEQVLHLDQRALLAMTDVRPGQKVFLSYRFDINGRPEAVVRVAASSSSMVVQSGQIVEVIAADPLGRTLTFRTDAGDSRTLLVDQRALVHLRDVRAGDSILMRTEDGRVVVITPR